MPPAGQGLFLQLKKERVGSDQEIVVASFSGVVASDHRLAANFVGAIRRTPAIRPPPSLMRYAIASGRDKRANVWRKVTNPRTGPMRQTSGTRKNGETSHTGIRLLKKELKHGYLSYG